jgi:hypothetical protein
LHIALVGFGLRLTVASCCTPCSRAAVASAATAPRSVVASFGRGHLGRPGFYGKSCPSCCSVPAKGLAAGVRGRGDGSGQPRPNNSFKPNPLRYTNNMADKACHVVGSTTRVGLTQALGPAPVVCGRVGVVGLLCRGIRGAPLRSAQALAVRVRGVAKQSKSDSASPHRTQVR